MQIGMFTGAEPRAMAELVLLLTHSPEITHLDALSHQVLDGLVYPGRPLADAASPSGFTHGSTAAYSEGIVTRGILLDLAPGSALEEGHGVTATDLDRAAGHAMVEPRSGDALIVRAGWDYAANRHRRLPGMTVDARRWMHHYDIALYAGDIGDAHPPVEPETPQALHRIGLARLGMPLDFYGPTQLFAMDADFASMGVTEAQRSTGIGGGLTSTDSSFESKFVGKNVGQLSASEKAQVDAIGYAESLPGNSPLRVVIQHGDADVNVPYLQSERLAKALKTRLGDDSVSFALIKGAVHMDGAFYTTSNVDKVRAFLSQG